MHCGEVKMMQLSRSRASIVPNAQIQLYLGCVDQTTFSTWEKVKVHLQLDDLECKKTDLTTDSSRPFHFFPPFLLCLVYNISEQVCPHKDGRSQPTQASVHD